MKSTKTMAEYMKLIKTKVNALALLDNPMDAEDVIDVILMILVMILNQSWIQFTTEINRYPSWNFMRS